MMIEPRRQAAGPIAALLIGGLLATTAAGCAGQTGSPEASDAPSLAPATPGQIHPRWRSCADEPSLRDQAGEFPPLIDGFHPVAAVNCGEDLQRRPDGGTDAIAVEDRADEVTALVAALRLPDEPPLPAPSAGDDEPASICDLGGYLLPKLVLLDAQGRWVRPGVPRDACGKPRAEFTTAMEQLRWKRIASRVLREAGSAEAAATGCSDAFADMVWVAGVDATGRRADLAPLAEDAATVRLCVYRVAPSEQGGDKPRGDLISGGVLPPGRWPAAKREIQAAGPAPGCTTPASRFAILETPQGDIHVELDGCLRLLAPAALPGDGTSFDILRQAPATLPTLLTRP